MLVIAVSIAYLLFRLWLNEKRLWRPVIAIIFLAWLAVIAASTLTDRTPGILPAKPELIPFHSYRAVLAGKSKEILRSNFMNVVLFYPAGLLACELLPKGWNRGRKIVCITVPFALISVAIEFCQYYYALGQAEVDDVIHNTLGTIIGALVCSIPMKQKMKKTENRDL